MTRSCWICHTKKVLMGKPRGYSWRRASNALTIFTLDLFFFLRFYLFIQERQRDRERQRHRPREKQAPHKEPDVGIDPGTMRSHPGPKAHTQPLSHQVSYLRSSSFFFFCLESVNLKNRVPEDPLVNV